MNEKCIFCKHDDTFSDPSKIIFENKYSYSRYDGFPVTPLHALIIPYEHVEDYFKLSLNQIADIRDTLQATLLITKKRDPSIVGYNIGINSGKAAGQTIPHLHIHFIPRREGDVDDPQGGVRHTIPGMGHY